MDTYYPELMRDTLIHLAENHFGHPQEFEHEEKQEPIPIESIKKIVFLSLFFF